MKTSLVWGSDDPGENGIWVGDYLVSLGELREAGYSLDYLLELPDHRLRMIAEQFLPAGEGK